MFMIQHSSTRRLVTYIMPGLSSCRRLWDAMLWSVSRMHRQRSYLVSHDYGSFAPLTCPSVDFLRHSTDCIEHGLAKEKIHLVCHHSHGIGSNLVRQVSRCCDSYSGEFWRHRPRLSH